MNQSVLGDIKQSLFIFLYGKTEESFVGWGEKSPQTWSTSYLVGVHDPPCLPFPTLHLGLLHSSLWQGQTSACHSILEAKTGVLLTKWTEQVSRIVMGA